MDSFDRMVQALRDKKFYVAIHDSSEGYCFCFAHDDDITAIFCEDHPDAPDHSRGRIAFDNKRALCKWSKCPYHLPLPKNKNELKYIFDKMEYLKTDEGLAKSIDYELREWEYK